MDFGQNNVATVELFLLLNSPLSTYGGKAAEKFNFNPQIAAQTAASCITGVALLFWISSLGSPPPNPEYRMPETLRCCSAHRYL